MKFLVTAGPTREPLDPVRYLSNRSSGKMGYAIAQAARDAGHEVVLVSGPVSLPSVAGAQTIAVVTADEMHDAVHGALAHCDIVVMCAAVADYKSAQVAAQKIKKQPGAISLELVPTRDILASLGALPQRDFLLVGFAAETNHLEEYAKAKLRAKNCDAIVANDISGTQTGMESDENAVTIFARDGQTTHISRNSKQNVANELVKIFSNMREKCLTKNL